MLPDSNNTVNSAAFFKEHLPWFQAGLIIYFILMSFALALTVCSRLGEKSKVPWYILGTEILVSGIPLLLGIAAGWPVGRILNAEAVIVICIVGVAILWALKEYILYELPFALFERKVKKCERNGGHIWNGRKRCVRCGAYYYKGSWDSDPEEYSSAVCDCGNRISSDQKSCPSCGRPNPGYDSS